MTSEGFSPLFSMVVPSAIRGDRLVRNESFWSGKQGEVVLANDLLSSMMAEWRVENLHLQEMEKVCLRQTLIENGA